MRARTLLVGGIVAGPLYLTVALGQALVRDGFDITRHAVSLLALGHGGWVQVANFVVTGTLVLACAAGLRAVARRGPGRTWGPPRPATVLGLWLGLTLTWIWLAVLAWRWREQAAAP